MSSQHIICLILDTWRLDYFGRMIERGWKVGVPGKGVRTPNLDHFAQRCHLFDHYVCGSTPCGPFRRDLWTGCYEFPFRGWGPILTSDQTHARQLRSVGFKTFYLTSNTPLVDASFWFNVPIVPENPIKGNYHVFFDGWENVRGVIHDNASVDPIPEELRNDWEKRCNEKPLKHHLEAYLRQRQYWHSEEDWPTARLFRQARRWVERNRSHKKTFLMIDCFAPHEVFDPPPYYSAYFRQEDGTAHHLHPEYGWAGGLYTEKEMDVIRADYAGDLAMVDRWLGMLLDQVEIMGGLEDTLIIITSDHGYYLGDHGFIGKPCAFSPIVPLHGCIGRAPLIVYDPKSPTKSPCWHNGLVQGVDLYATMLDFAASPIPEKIMGKSLLPMIREGALSIRPIGISGNNAGLIQITNGRYTLIPAPVLPLSSQETFVLGGGIPEIYKESLLFDIDADPEEKHNLIKVHPEIERELRERGGAYLRDMQAPDRFILRVAPS